MKQAMQGINKGKRHEGLQRELISFGDGVGRINVEKTQTICEIYGGKLINL